jgi:dihydrofolate reductase
MIVALIAAVAKNGVIGCDGDLPWRLPEELRRFKALTMGHHLVVGRRTWESIGRALPGRTMVVVSRDPNYEVPEGVVLVGSLPAAFDVARAAGDDECFVGGGGEIYRLALPLADRIYLTHVDVEARGEVTFPALDPAQWHEVSRTSFPADDRHAHAFAACRYDRA